MKSNVNLSGLALSNVEALANDEIEGGDPCYNCGTYDIDYPKVVYCANPKCYYSNRKLPLWTTTSLCPYANVK